MYKEKIAKLMEAVKDEPYDLNFVETRMNAFTDYVSYVTYMETHMQRLNVEGIRGQEYRDQIQSMDRHRRSKHEVAMGAINQLNRLSEAMKLEPFYDGPVDNEHRNQVGDVIGQIVNEYFEGRAVGHIKQKELMGEDDFTQAVENIPEASQTVERF